MKEAKNKIGTFKWSLSKECVPAVGALIETHFGISHVIESQLLDPLSPDVEEWLERSEAEVGEERVYSFYDEKGEDPFFEDGFGGLGLKLLTAKGPVFVLMAHTHYNRSGLLCDRTWWCGNYQPTFTEVA